MTLSLAVTPGEPAGIGIDVLLQLVQNGSPHELIAIADPSMLRQRARELGLEITLREPSGKSLRPGELAFESVSFATPVAPGKPDTANAESVLRCLDLAIDGCRTGRYAGLVTGPVHKGIINEAGHIFTGHTEYLAERCTAQRVVMLLCTTELRVALATTHVPLRAVPDLISITLLEEILKIIERDLRQRMGIHQPRILVCGLNPHAGEGGHLGDEEVRIIGPAIEKLRAQGLEISGPMPADTVFTPHHLQYADVVLAMYHDQGLPVLKSRGFGNAVNVTLGLPILRTSVDHGTAFELAGTGRAHTGSLRAAIACLADMALHSTAS